MDRPFTPEQLAKLRAKRRRKWEERRRRAIEAWLSWQQDISRQIEEARRRRKRFLLWLLVGLVLTQALCNLFISRPIIYQPEPVPKPPRRLKQQGKKAVGKSEEWNPSPENDFAPQPGHDNFIDGYSRETWERYVDERGWRPGSKLAQKRAWENDPQRPLFPLRYREWDHRPSLFELTREFFDRHQRSLALEALMIVAPPEARSWLSEASALDPGQIRLAFADRSDIIAANFKKSAARWEEDKRKEAEDTLKEATKPNNSKNSKKIDANYDDDEEEGQSIQPIK